MCFSNGCATRYPAVTGRSVDQRAREVEVALCQPSSFEASIRLAREFGWTKRWIVLEARPHNRAITRALYHTRSVPRVKPGQGGGLHEPIGMHPSTGLVGQHPNRDVFVADLLRTSARPRVDRYKAQPCPHSAHIGTDETATACRRDFSSLTDTAGCT